MSIGYGDLRKGMAIDLDGEPHIVVEYESRKMQQRAPVMRVRFRAIRSGRIVDKTFNGYDVKLSPAAVDRRNAQYIYDEDELYYFMDEETFDQFPLSKESMPDAIPFLVEQMVVEMVFYEDNPIAIELPFSVELEVTDSPPGLKGDTATGATKLATLETGHQLQVPLFVNEGEKIKVDTRSGEYLSRA